MHTFTLSKFPSTIEGFRFKKSRPKDPNDNGAITKVLSMELNATPIDRMELIEHIFPGITAMSKEIAKEESAGSQVRAKKKLGVVNFSILDPQGTVLFTASAVKGGIPTAVISNKAEEIWVSFEVEVSIQKDQMRIFEDYFKADTLCTIESSQTDLQDAVKAKPKGKLKSKIEIQTELPT